MSNGKRIATLALGLTELQVAFGHTMATLLSLVEEIELRMKYLDIVDPQLHGSVQEMESIILDKIAQTEDK